MFVFPFAVQPGMGLRDRDHRSARRSALFPGERALREVDHGAIAAGVPCPRSLEACWWKRAGGGASLTFMTRPRSAPPPPPPGGISVWAFRQAKIAKIF